MGLPRQPCTSSSYLWLEFLAPLKGVSNSRDRVPMDPNLPPPAMPTRPLSTGKKWPRITHGRRPPCIGSRRNPWKRDKLLTPPLPWKNYHHSLSSMSRGEGRLQWQRLCQDRDPERPGS